MKLTSLTPTPTPTTTLTTIPSQPVQRPQNSTSKLPKTPTKTPRPKLPKTSLKTPRKTPPTNTPKTKIQPPIKHKHPQNTLFPQPLLPQQRAQTQPTQNPLHTKTLQTISLRKQHTTLVTTLTQPMGRYPRKSPPNHSPRTTPKPLSPRIRTTSYNPNHQSQLKPTLTTQL